jgi:hypothetical protein
MSNNPDRRLGDGGASGESGHTLTITHMVVHTAMKPMKAMMIRLYQSSLAIRSSIAPTESFTTQMVIR